MVHIVRQYSRVSGSSAVVAEIPGTTITIGGRAAYLFKRIAGIGQLGLADDRLIVVTRTGHERVGTCLLNQHFTERANAEGSGKITNQALLATLSMLRDHGDHDDVKGFDIRVYKLRSQQGYALTYRTGDENGPITVRYFDNADEEIAKDKNQPRYRVLCERLGISA
ncbi:MAG: hypothetical protein EBQ96_02355 [Proteobacteria bacterium]|nr:hypothetical protein [Pseudomonadota bacterium]